MSLWKQVSISAARRTALEGRIGGEETERCSNSTFANGQQQLQGLQGWQSRLTFHCCLGLFQPPTIGFSRTSHAITSRGRQSGKRQKAEQQPQHESSRRGQRRQESLFRISKKVGQPVSPTKVTGPPGPTAASPSATADAAQHAATAADAAEHEPRHVPPGRAREPCHATAAAAILCASPYDAGSPALCTALPLRSANATVSPAGSLWLPEPAGVLSSADAAHDGPDAAAFLSNSTRICASWQPGAPAAAFSTAAAACHAAATTGPTAATAR